MNLSSRGVFLALLASVLFATVPGFAQRIAPLDGIEVVAWRVLWSLPMGLLLIALARQWSALVAVFARLRREPRLIAALGLSALLIGVQWWLFLWAPQAGRMTEVSLGYFLLPLSMVLAGRLFYAERLRPLLRLAVGCAALGVAHELWRTGSFSWVCLVTPLGYPPYFMLRRWMRLDALTGFLLEMLVLLPLALWVLGQGDVFAPYTRNPDLAWLLPMITLLSTLAFVAFTAASRLLPMGLFGILSYLEPVLLFAVAVTLLGETFAVEQLATYLPIWLAVLLVAGDSAWVLRSQSRASRSTS